jgi:CheY-like chemotaxis protein
MPTLDGNATAREIRKTAWGKNLKLIALSGWGQDEARQKSRAAGFDDHLVKPLNPAALAMLLNKARGADEMSTQGTRSQRGG